MQLHGRAYRPTAEHEKMKYRASHRVRDFWAPAVWAPVWYENLSGVVIRPDKSRHKHR